MLASFMLILGLLTLGFGFYLSNGGQSLLVIDILFFVSSLLFNALQPRAHALEADQTAPPAYLGAMFCMMNLVGEIGAVLSPAISGVLRDATGAWNVAVILDAGIVLVGFVVLIFIRETGAAQAEAPSGIEATS
jgi:ACS family D-galactonate transporter-like MFS transporter